MEQDESAVRARGFVYLRRNLADSDVAGVETYLQREAAGRFFIEPWGASGAKWTRISLWDARDVARLRKSFAQLIDGYSVGEAEPAGF